MAREGGCFCGAIRYRVDAEPANVTHCHCENCRRIGGAAFVTWAEVPLDRFQYLKGAPTTFEPREGVTRAFCDRCGTPLSYHNDTSPDSIDLIALTLDDPERLRPEDHTWCERMLGWVHLADGLPQHPRQRGR